MRSAGEATASRPASRSTARSTRRAGRWSRRSGPRSMASTRTCARTRPRNRRAERMRVEARGLGVRLGGRVVFAELAFDWEGPGVIAVTGANGSGKTTLLKVVAGLLAPGRGSVAWNDEGRALKAQEARARLGLVSPEIA